MIILGDTRDGFQQEIMEMSQPTGWSNTRKTNGYCKSANAVSNSGKVCRRLFVSRHYEYRTWALVLGPGESKMAKGPTETGSLGKQRGRRPVNQTRLVNQTKLDLREKNSITRTEFKARASL